MATTKKVKKATKVKDTSFATLEEEIDRKAYRDIELAYGADSERYKRYLKVSARLKTWRTRMRRAMTEVEKLERSKARYEKLLQL